MYGLSQERRRYTVTSFLNDWAHIHNEPWQWLVISMALTNIIVRITTVYACSELYRKKFVDWPFVLCCFVGIWHCVGEATLKDKGYI